MSPAIKLENDEFSDPNLRYKPFLSDPLMMELVNLNFEFQVGGALITIMNNEQILKCDPDDIVAKSKIRLLSKGKDLVYSELPPNTIVAPDNKLESYLEPLLWCGCEIDILQTDCNTVRVFGRCRNTLFLDGDATVKVFLMNGKASTQVLDQRITGSFDFYVPMNFSTFVTSQNVFATADPDCFSGKTVSANFVASKTKNTCDSRDRATPDLEKRDGDVLMAYKVKYYTTWLSNYEEADQHSFALSPRGTFVGRNAILSTSIFTTRKDANFDCQVINSEDEDKDCNNCRSRNASVNYNPAGSGPGGKKEELISHCNGDVLGRFRLENNGKIITASASINDFECCTK
jgi:hypothetical protein